MTFKNFKRIFAVGLLIAMLVTVFSVGIGSASAADSSTQSQIKEIDEKIKELNKKIENDKKNLSAQKSTKANLDDKIAAMQQKIDLCNKQISETRAAIAASEKKISEKNAEIESTKEKFKRRIRSLYTSNTSSSIQVLLGAESFSDLLTRTELTKCISAQDTAIVEELVSVIGEINKEIESNKARQAQLDSDLASLNAAKAELNDDIKEVNGIISSLNNGISTSQKDLNNLNNYLNNLLYGGEIDAEFNGKFIWPVPGNYNVSCEFDSHDPLHPTGHNGMDITAARGTRIVASSTGKVTYMYNSCKHDYKKYSSCGCGGGFGNHVRISHGWYNGKHFLTVYGHMKNVASGINNGTQVNQGQLIGYVGSTGFSTGPHLHFGVAVKRSGSTTIYQSDYVDPRKYLR